MSETVQLERHDEVAVITIDDGKANALSPGVIGAVNAALDEIDAAGPAVRAVVVCGRDGMFSGGFDLKVMRSGDMAQMYALVTSGGELVTRMYSSPRPVVCAVTGHAIAAGALLTLAGHLRIGVEGDFKIGLIETTIGMVLPDWAVLIAELRLSRRQVERAVVEARVYGPGEARDAGYFDLVVPPGDVLSTAIAEAGRLGALDPTAYAGNAEKLRGPGVARLREALARDRALVV
ncbi:MAG: crotonase/enoyl-CoA hydratase family protein [Acidimicrobiales bacterium]